MRNVSFVEEADINEADLSRMQFWDPQKADEAGACSSRILLSGKFYSEITDHPIPIDLRAMRALKASPLALDIYAWLTYRMSYLRRKSTIPWPALKHQFGAGYADTDQGLRDFKRAFLRELLRVHELYKAAHVESTDAGLVLHPSNTHIPKLSQQGNLFEKK